MNKKKLKKKLKKLQLKYDTQERMLKSKDSILKAIVLKEEGYGLLELQQKTLYAIEDEKDSFLWLGRDSFLQTGPGLFEFLKGQS